MQNDRPALAAAYLSLAKGLNVVVLPVAIAIGVSAAIVVPSVWGREWQAAVPVMQVVAVLALLQSWITPVGQLLKALDRPGWLLWWSAIFSVCTAGFVTLGAHLGGLVGAAQGMVASAAVGFLMMGFMLQRLLGVTMASQAGALLPSLACGAVMCAAALGLLALLEFVNQFVDLLVALCCGVAAFLGCLVLIDRPFVLGALNWLTRKTGTSGRAG
jgi:O-antigen/teichoic acid export membrane protein